MRFLSLVSDAFGGFGGISLYNRDLLQAFCNFAHVREIVCLPRNMRFPPENRPKNLRYLTNAVNHKGLYSASFTRLLARDRDFQVIHCGHVKLLPIAFLARALCRAPILLTIFGIDVWDSSASHLPITFFKKVPFVISISRFTKEQFLEWAPVKPQRVRVIPNAVHLEAFGPGKGARDLVLRYGLEGKQVIMTLGRMVSLERYKGFDEVLELMPELLKEFPRLIYLIVGEGTDLARLKEKALRLGVDSKVIFTGRIPEEEKAEHFKLADAYVMPSRGEGFGYVFLEALACGIPVLGSFLDGSREALRDGMLGALVDPRSPDDLFQGVRRVLQAPRGIVPEGLKYFSYPNFERRCHQFLNEIKIALFRR